MIRDRNIDPRAAVGEEVVVFHRGGTGGIPASVTGFAQLPYFKRARIVRIGAIVRAKANADNTVTLTFKTGSTTVGTVAFTNGGTLAPSSVVNVPHAAGAILSVDSGALGGSSPSFNDATIYVVLRRAGPDIHN